MPCFGLPFSGVVCIPDSTEVPDTTSVCSRRDLHTPCPRGYVAWHEWAERTSATHTQLTCPGCGLWKVWLPHAEAKAAQERRWAAMQTESDRCIADALARQAARRRTKRRR